MPMTVLVVSSLTHSLTSSEMFSLMSSEMRSEVILESGIMKAWNSVPSTCLSCRLPAPWPRPQAAPAAAAASVLS